MNQAEYIKNWHDSFVVYIQQLSFALEILLNDPKATNQDRDALILCRHIILGKDASEIEESLSKGIVNKKLFDKLEKLDKDLVDIAVKHINTDVIIKEFLKHLTYLQIEHTRRDAETCFCFLNKSSLEQ